MRTESQNQFRKLTYLEGVVNQQAYQIQQLQQQNYSLKTNLQRQKENCLALQEYKAKVNKVINILLIILLVSCLCIVGWCGYSIYKQYTEGHTPVDENVLVETEVEQPIDKRKPKKKTKKYLSLNWVKLKQKYPNIIGWLYIPNTNINFPVVQNKQDGNFYLTHSAEDKPSELGAIFLDNTQPNNFSDENTIVYGHSVDFVGGMFTDLTKFVDKEFFDKNKEFYILTPKTNYKVGIRVFAETVDGSSYYVVDSKGQKTEVEKTQKQNAMHYRNITSKGNIITLSTCKPQTYGAKKYVLQGVLTKYEGKIEVK